jgi:hypothetical protein
MVLFVWSVSAGRIDFDLQSSMICRPADRRDSAAVSGGLAYEADNEFHASGPGLSIEIHASNRLLK